MAFVLALGAATTVLIVFGISGGEPSGSATTLLLGTDPRLVQNYKIISIHARRRVGSP
jgi:hypothetical protein